MIMQIILQCILLFSFSMYFYINLIAVYICFVTFVVRFVDVISLLQYHVVG